MIRPYSRHPPPPRVGILVSPSRYLDEDGDKRSTSRAPKGLNLYADRSTSWGWVTRGAGSAICWNLVPIYYLPDQHPAGGLRVRLFADMPGSREYRVRGLKKWRDWLAAFGAAGLAPTTASMSLLRSSIRQPIGVGFGTVPPIPFVLGGRIADVGGPGMYSYVSHFDLSASYARAISDVAYGGRWVHWEGRVPPLADGEICIVRALVRFPRGLAFGPLPKRPPANLSPGERKLRIHDYPTDQRTMRGLWALPELAAAEEVGCSYRVIESWTHEVPGGRRPFRRWYEAITQGRSELRGFAATLAKQTGNVLWSQFAIDGDGERTLAKRVGDEVRHFPLPLDGGGSRNVDKGLAESVTGWIRARLYRDLLVPWGADAVCVHTDGGWIQALGDPRHGPQGDGWRIKHSAHTMHYLSPTRYRWGSLDRARWNYVFAGVDSADAPTSFAEEWDRWLWEESRKERGNERQTWEKGLSAEDREALDDARRRGRPRTFDNPPASPTPIDVTPWRSPDDDGDDDLRQPPSEPAEARPPDRRDRLFDG